LKVAVDLLDLGQFRADVETAHRRPARPEVDPDLGRTAPQFLVMPNHIDPALPLVRIDDAGLDPGAAVAVDLQEGHV
jgi:hypothetical protein